MPKCVCRSALSAASWLVNLASVMVRTIAVMLYGIMLMIQSTKKRRQAGSRAMVPDNSRCWGVREPLQGVERGNWSEGRWRGSSLEHQPPCLPGGSVVMNATAAPIETYQKNQLLWPMSPSNWMTSGAVPPKRATVGLYQAPIPRHRSLVGNSSLMIAGAIELFIA